MGEQQENLVQTNKAYVMEKAVTDWGLLCQAEQKWTQIELVAIKSNI